MSAQDLPITSYALMGLLTFGDELTGYELKQRADNTLRFYWQSPAMSQVSPSSRDSPTPVCCIAVGSAGGRRTP